jgi:outer membrane protein TolC
LPSRIIRKFKLPRLLPQLPRPKPGKSAPRIKAWLDANSGYQRLSVVEQLVNQATLALNLAQARYQLGLSSIVELTQAQLNLTQAQIVSRVDLLDYQTQLSVLNYQIGNRR